MGNVFDITARLAGAIVSFVVVSVILLRGSVLLGVIMLVGGPLLLASLSRVAIPSSAASWHSVLGPAC